MTFEQRLAEQYTVQGAQNLGTDFCYEPNPFSEYSSDWYAFEFGREIGLGIEMPTE